MEALSNLGQFFKDERQMANKQMKACFVSLVNRELQTKTPKYCFTPISLAKCFKSDITKCC